MDYEKKYRDLVEAVKELQESNPSDDGIQKWVKDNVPELNESEDEKIRKALVKHCREQLDIYKTLQTAKEYGEIQSWITWLEKHGETDSSIKWHDVSEKPEKNRELLCEWQGSDNCIWHDTVFYNPDNEAFWNYGRQVDYVTRWCYVDDIVKRCEQKESPCDRCKRTQPSHSCQDITELGRCYLEHEKQDEQKLVNKVEPKFKVGDWITDGNITIQIEAIKNGCYLYCGDCALYSTKTADKVYHLWTIQDAKDGDVLTSGGVIFIFNKIHGEWVKCHFSLYKDKSFIINSDLMTIKYGKETYPATKEQREALEKAMLDAGYEWDADKKELKKIEQEYHCNGVREPKESTGVLKQLLNKENYAWSEEDEVGFDDAMWAIEQARTIAKDENDMGNLWYAEHWLKSLKDRVQSQPKQEWSDTDLISLGYLAYFVDNNGDKFYGKNKPDVVKWIYSFANRTAPQQEWSEEDETMIESIIDYMKPMPILFESTTGKSGKEYTKEFIKDATKWLKSLKERYIWKPSEEQMDALETAVSSLQSTALESLYQDLKKL